MEKYSKDKKLLWDTIGEKNIIFIDWLLIKFRNACSPKSEIYGYPLILNFIYHYKDDKSVSELINKDEIFESIKTCLNYKFSKFVIFIFDLDIFDKRDIRSGHTNIIIMDKETKKAYRFEPHGQITNIGENSNLINSVINKELKIFFDKL